MHDLLKTPIACIALALVASGCGSPTVRAPRTLTSCESSHGCISLFATAEPPAIRAAAVRTLALADRECRQTRDLRSCRAAVELRVSDRVQVAPGCIGAQDVPLRSSPNSERYLPLDAKTAVEIAAQLCKPNEVRVFAFCDLAGHGRAFGIGVPYDGVHPWHSRGPGDPYEGCYADPIDLDPVLTEEARLRMLRAAEAALQRGALREASALSGSLSALANLQGWHSPDPRYVQWATFSAKLDDADIAGQGDALLAHGDLDAALRAFDRLRPPTGTDDGRSARLAHGLMSAFLARLTKAVDGDDLGRAGSDMLHVDELAKSARAVLTAEEQTRIERLRSAIGMREVRRVTMADQALRRGRLTEAAALLADLHTPEGQKRAGAVASRVWLARSAPLALAKRYAAAFLCTQCGLELLDHFPAPARAQLDALRSEAERHHLAMAGEAAQLGFSGGVVLHRRLARSIAGTAGKPATVSNEEQAALKGARAPTWSAVTVVAAAGSAPCAWLAEGLAASAADAPWPRVRVELIPSTCTLDLKTWTAREPYTHQVTKRLCHEEGGSRYAVSGQHRAGTTICDGSLTETVTEVVEVRHHKTTARVDGSVTFDGKSSGLRLSTTREHDGPEGPTRAAVVATLLSALGPGLDAFRMERAVAEHRELEVEHLWMLRALREPAGSAAASWLSARYGLDAAFVRSRVLAPGP